MRHNKKINHLGRTSSHRHALLSNMACSLILHKRIQTTLAKAKALKVYVEPLLTKAKTTRLTLEEPSSLTFVAKKLLLKCSVTLHRKLLIAREDIPVF